MPPVGFEPTISAGERPQTYALDPAGTLTGLKMVTGQNLQIRKDYIHNVGDWGSVH